MVHPRTFSLGPVAVVDQTLLLTVCWTSFESRATFYNTEQTLCVVNERVKWMADKVGPQEGCHSCSHGGNLASYMFLFLFQLCFGLCLVFSLLFPPAVLTSVHLLHFIELLVCLCYEPSITKEPFCKLSAWLFNRKCASVIGPALFHAVNVFGLWISGVSDRWHRPQSCLKSCVEVEPWDSQVPRSSAGWADNCAPQKSLEWIWVERFLWTPGEFISESPFHLSVPGVVAL